MRLYPDHIPLHDHEPTTENFEVIEKEGCGKALITKRDWKKGDIVMVFSGEHVPQMTQHSLQLPRSIGGHIHDEWAMGYVLHKCNPNCYVSMNKRCFIARRDIKAGDFITMNYNQTEDFLYQDFNCACVNGSCRGKFTEGTLIQGRKGTQDKAEARRMRAILEHKTWHFAKTLAHMPHFYTRGREWDNHDEFVEACQYIFDHGVRDTFALTGKYVYYYLYLGDWKYWVMEGSKPAGMQILINRADPRLEYGIERAE